MPSSPAPIVRGELTASGDDRFPHRLLLGISSPRAMRGLMGELGANLKVLGRTLRVRLSVRGEQLTISGELDQIERAFAVIQQLVELLRAGHVLSTADIDQASRMLVREPDVRLLELYSDTISVGKKRLHPRSLRQRDYIQAVRTSPLVFGVGPAGTGKTYLAMAMAVSSLLQEDVRRIILCRPAVEAGEKLGFLPGDLVAKVNPYLRPLYDALFDLVGFDRGTRLIEKNVIEVAPLAFMRGRTLSDSFVILDEAQNTTVQQMKMFLTRIGIGSRAVVTGDPTQVDLPRGQRSGLADALYVLNRIDDISIIQLTDADVVRHPLVSQFVRAYERDADRARAAREAHRRGHREE
jgi:phosphate starvation-inducible PhoH-like protein